MTTRRKYNPNITDRAMDLIRCLTFSYLRTDSSGNLFIDDNGQEAVCDWLRREYRLGQMQQRAAARKRAK